jgi:probable poly-beta-1,6-N-acetyl-D-glucosamine export protein
MYLRSFEYFRAIAIVLIVAGHCYGISGWHISSFADRVVANIITGGTTLFVFISGFLFHHVFYQTFNYRIFMKKKARNVFLPYLFLSIFAIAQALIIHGPFPEWYFGQQQTVMDQVIKPILLYLLTGGVFAYWYIPFIMCIFLLSPLFIRFIHCSAPTRIGITSLLLLISLFMQRPVNNFFVPQSVVFFTPVYLFGILCSIHKEWIYKNLGNRNLILLAGAFLLAVLQALLFKACGDFQKPPFQLQGVDINLLQKMLLCLFFLTFLHRYEALDSRLLKALASSSFSIYFLHGWVIYGVSLFQSSYAAVYGFHLVPLSASLILLVSYLLASQIKVMFPKNSRMLIGW